MWKIQYITSVETMETSCHRWYCKLPSKTDVA